MKPKDADFKPKSCKNTFKKNFWWILMEFEP